MISRQGGTSSFFAALTCFFAAPCFLAPAFFAAPFLPTAGRFLTGLFLADFTDFFLMTFFFTSRVLAGFACLCTKPFCLLEARFDALSPRFRTRLLTWFFPGDFFVGFLTGLFLTGFRTTLFFTTRF